MYNTQKYVTTSVQISTCRAKGIGSLINCIIISKHSDFFSAVKAPERRQIWCWWATAGRKSTGTTLSHSHSDPYWLTQQWHRGGALPLALHPAAESHLCTQPWDTESGSAYEKDSQPSVWQSIQCSCILNFKVVFDRKQRNMILGCECVPLRWKIFSLPWKALAQCKEGPYK